MWMQQKQGIRNYSPETEVEVDEVLRLMGHVRTEVAPHHAVPRRIVPAEEVRAGLESITANSEPAKWFHVTKTGFMLRRLQAFELAARKKAWPQQVGTAARRYSYVVSVATAIPLRCFLSNSFLMKAAISFLGHAWTLQVLQLSDATTGLGNFSGGQGARCCTSPMPSG